VTEQALSKHAWLISHRHYAASTTSAISLNPYCGKKSTVYYSKVFSICTVVQTVPVSRHWMRIT